jgi:hypothetical protein
MKNNNYYAVHKNKKPKRRLQNTNWKSFYDVISKANELVKSLIELRTATLMFAQPIPKYKQGGQNELMQFEGGINNYGRAPKNIGKYKEITEQIKKALN